MLSSSSHIIYEHFANEEWRTRDVLGEAICCENFYFDEVCQIRMPYWSKNLVTLVGDAACCATLATGMGGSLAIVGAAALADAFRKHEGNSEESFQEYDKSLRALRGESAG